MAIQIQMPKIGLTMMEGKIIEWKKKEGERVEKGEILFVFETEKVTIEVEAPQSGFLAKILAQVDDVVPIGGVVGLLVDKEGEVVEAAVQRPEPIPQDAEKRSLEVKIDKGPRAAKTDKVRATPMAKKLAKEHGIDLTGISGSGPGGRIKARDVVAAVDKKSFEAVLPQVVEEKLVKLSGMRRIIAQKMLATKIETAQTYMTVSIDATEILEAREKLTPVVAKRAGVHLTITDLLMKITASALKLHPNINTRWTPEGILWIKAIHMGMAMALEEGLIVPVIWDIGNKSLYETAKSRVELVEKGRAGKLTPDDMKGSTFTLSSLGMYGIEEFTGIINQPESAILAVGAILDTPVVVKREVVIRPMMKITLSYDHRVIDGAKAAEFMKTLKELMEAPILIFV